VISSSPSSSDAVIQLRGVVKTFGSKVAVNNLDLTIPAQSTYGFIGPNGAGKTTTIRMIMSIIFPDSGDVRVLGKNSAVESKDRIGYLPEERGLYKKMKVGAFLHYMGRLKGLDGAGLDSRVRNWLDRVYLGETYKKRCEELSKGMQQKVQFIAAVIHEPDLIILDEPFSGLDPVNRRLLRGLIDDQRTQGRTLIFSTHAMFEAEQLCTHLFMIHQGKKVIDLPLAEVFRQHDPNALMLETINPSDAQSTAWESCEGVETADVVGGTVQITLNSSSTPQEVMPRLFAMAPIRKLEIKRPNLEDIFVKFVGGDMAALNEEKEEFMDAKTRQLAPVDSSSSNIQTYAGGGR